MYLYSVNEANLSPAEQALDIVKLVNGGSDAEKLADIAGPMTHRSADRLAKFYGFTGLRGLCADLPSEARIFDAGAGLSGLGNAVARRRPDVSWVNFDIRYGLEELPSDDRRALTALQNRAPENVTYLGGNALNLPAELHGHSFDRGFSYYMFPHIIDSYGLELARVAMGNLLGLIKFPGTFSTGPNRYHDFGWTVSVPESGQVNALAAEMIGWFIESRGDSDRRDHNI